MLKNLYDELVVLVMLFLAIGERLLEFIQRGIDVLQRLGAVTAEIVLGFFEVRLGVLKRMHRVMDFRMVLVMHRHGGGLRDGRRTERQREGDGRQTKDFLHGKISRWFTETLTVVKQETVATDFVPRQSGRKV